MENMYSWIQRSWLNVTNKEKALITYNLIKERKAKKAKARIQDFSSFKIGQVYKSKKKR